MWFYRRRSDRPDAVRYSLGSGLEALEGRALLSRDGINPFSVYLPRDLSVYELHTDTPAPYSVKHQLLSNPSTQNPLLGNDGKIVSGKDRQGNEWTIVVHGPGTVIVNDITPNDGSLDDAIDTIQLVGTDIHKTYVTGNVVGSFRLLTNSTVGFNRLIDNDGVRSVVLNGFTLEQTTPVPSGTPNNLNTGIYLLGGVQYLSFHNIVAPIDTANNDAAINVVIGDPSTPLPDRVQPTIHLDSIFNTVFSSTATGAPALTPQTTPSVNIIVNGQIKDLSFLSTTNDTVPAGQQFLFPTVATTGRTSVQAIGINSLHVAGAATNFTASRAARPFQNGFSGLSRLGSAHFGGPTDAVGLDVNGPIGALQYDRGVGNPNGVFLGTTTVTDPVTDQVNNPEVPATLYGLPVDQFGYAAAGLVDGQVTATNIGALTVRPANVVTQSPTNPDFTQITRQGTLFTVPRPGTALQNALIAASGNIGHVSIVGDQRNTEIKSGFHYPSFAAGLQGTRAPSGIGPLRQTGDMINGVTTATYRPFAGKIYGTPADVAGPGRIIGNFNGVLNNTWATTPLVRTGAGFFARKKVGGYLPPPVAPTRVNNILVR